jgi:hypothetical protein
LHQRGRSVCAADGALSVAAVFHETRCNVGVIDTEPHKPW